jgi:class 3 adenylate cyclase/hemoglobin-like flavoprotein
MGENNHHFKVHYSSINQTVEVANASATLLAASIENKIPHMHECGGHGLCTTCRVRVINGLNNLSPPTLLEKELSIGRNWDPTVRLACQARIQGDVTIKRLVWSSADVTNLQKEMINRDSGEERSLAILFCDMRNFTSIAEKNLSYDLAYMLNRFYTILGDPILMNNGIIYQYVGDEITGLFGTDKGDSGKICMDALRAAFGMLHAVERLNRLEMNEFDTVINVGIGIHFGKAFVGHIGHPENKQFCVLGDPVNVASRIQGHNKTLKTQLLISGEFLDQLKPDLLDLGKSDMVQLRGKKKGTQIHEALKFKDPDINFIIQTTINTILQDEARFAEKFYARVFEKDPSLRGLFKKNMVQQGRMLTHMLGGIVYSLSRPQHLKLGLRTLGQQHEKYGVKAEYYPIIREAMIETIGDQLGDENSEEVHQAWGAALDMIIGMMQKR